MNSTFKGMRGFGFCYFRRFTGGIKCSDNEQVANGLLSATDQIEG